MLSILNKLILKHWYHKSSVLLSIILLPLSLLFFIIASVRRLFYKFRLLKSNKLPVKLIVVGNISVGGVGKTPFCKFLATELIKRGLKVGVILRGYKAKQSNPQLVTPNLSGNLVGDESLIYANAGIPVAIGKNRYDAGKCLLYNYPDLDVIISDDGLQHYSLGRDYEIAVVDSTRMMGNNFVLPNGPLRENLSRLKNVNAVLFNSQPNLQSNAYKNIISCNSNIFIQQFVLDKITNGVTNQQVEPHYFIGKRVLVMAAIGNPDRFFNFLSDIKIDSYSTHVMPDHYSYSPEDIPSGYDCILVTEKDYVKLKPFNNDKIWCVYIKVHLNDESLIRDIANLCES